MKKRAPPQPLIVEIDHLEPGALGAGILDGRKVLVRGVPPGAQVEAWPVRRKRGVLHARRKTMLRLPPEAVEPRCALFGVCGGCALQEIPLDVQRRAKDDMVRRHVGPLDGLIVHPITGSPEAWSWRNKVELSFGLRQFVREVEAGGHPPNGRFLGFHAPERFDRIVEVPRCEIIPEGLNRILAVVREHLPTSSMEAWDVYDGSGFWRHLLLRETQVGERLAVFYTAPPEDEAAALAELQALADRLPDVHCVAWFVADRVGDAAQGHLRAWLRGEPVLRERLGNIQFRLAPTSFFQVNGQGAEVLYDVVARMAGTGRLLLDLYCGAGSIGLWLAPSFERVLGVESSVDAVSDARVNADLNGLGPERIRFVAGTVESVLPDSPDSPLAPAMDADVIIVDPPRVGLHPRVSTWLAGHPARRLVYVACHPPSLGRDRLALEAGGWRLAELQAVDLFPQTGHVEVLGCFVRD